MILMAFIKPILRSTVSKTNPGQALFSSHRGVSHFGEKAAEPIATEATVGGLRYRGLRHRGGRPGPSPVGRLPVSPAEGLTPAPGANRFFGRRGPGGLFPLRLRRGPGDQKEVGRESREVSERCRFRRSPGGSGHRVQEVEFIRFQSVSYICLQSKSTVLDYINS